MSAGSNATISFSVLNAGPLLGAEVWQVYVQGALPGDPPRALKGFGHTGELAPGAAAAAALQLGARQLQWWSVERHAWQLYPPGAYGVAVGASSRDLRLFGSVVVEAAA